LYRFGEKVHRHFTGLLDFGLVVLGGADDDSHPLRLRIRSQLLEDLHLIQLWHHQIQQQHIWRSCPGHLQTLLTIGSTIHLEPCITQGRCHGHGQDI
jgi:hypothetical protein